MDELERTGEKRPWPVLGTVRTVGSMRETRPGVGNLRP
jgi:hypothetical protein